MNVDHEHTSCREKKKKSSESTGILGRNLPVHGRARKRTPGEAKEKPLNNDVGPRPEA